MDVPSIWMDGPCPQGNVTGASVFNGGATVALSAGMEIRARPTGSGDSTPVKGGNWSLGERPRICTRKESVVSDGKSITPPLGTARTRQVPEALVMAILVGREAWEDSVREIELMVRRLLQ